MAVPRLSTISLYTGVGGLDFGFEAGGVSYCSGSGAGPHRLSDNSEKSACMECARA